MDDPVVGPDSLLVEVAAAGINPVDWKIVAGYLQGAFPHHLPMIPGWDVAGTVRAVGPAVIGVAPGDRGRGLRPQGPRAERHVRRAGRGPRACLREGRPRAST